jgi:mono/diheme cytochrome c family protein
LHAQKYALDQTATESTSLPCAVRPARLWIICAVLSAMTGTLCDAAESTRQASVARGEHLARLICSACHVVASDQEFPPLLRQPAPSFSDIANRADVSEKSLRHFITRTHWDEQTLPMTMPDPMLTEEQTVAVIRYILALRGR